MGEAISKDSWQQFPFPALLLPGDVVVMIVVLFPHWEASMVGRFRAVNHV